MKKVKIGLPIEDESYEWVWADEVSPGRYKIDNLPWFSRAATYEDVVSATPDIGLNGNHNGMFRFDEILERGPYETVTLVFNDGVPEKTYLEIIDSWAEEYGVDVERGMAAMFAMIYTEEVHDDLWQALYWYHEQGFLHAYA